MRFREALRERLRTRLHLLELLFEDLEIRDRRGVGVVGGGDGVARRALAHGLDSLQIRRAEIQARALGTDGRREQILVVAFQPGRLLALEGDLRIALRGSVESVARCMDHVTGILDVPTVEMPQAETLADPRESVPLALQ